MSDAPVYEIAPDAFFRDPYPDLARMRAECPIAYVPQFGATLLTRRDTIHREEKRIEVFSSEQPGGLMTVLMGENMMRKDGAAHQAERRALFPAISPRTVNDHWRALFALKAMEVLTKLAPKGQCDLVTEYAMPVSAEALKLITGLRHMTAAEMDGSSQAMLDGCANYVGNPEIETRCHAATALIDEHIDRTIADAEEHSALAVLRDAGEPMERIRANIKLVISGGQNEPRDVIAGTAWAMLSHPDQLARIQSGAKSWSDAFAEYTRWMSPVGMSPRRVARTDTVEGVNFEPEERVFLMFSSANRDEAHFENPDVFDIDRDTSPAIAFGAGPHFCAGAAASRCLIVDVALPLLFARLPSLRLDGETDMAGWAFRGPRSVPVRWDR